MSDTRSLAAAINNKGNDETGELRLRRGVVQSIGSGFATVRIGGVDVAGIPVYRNVSIAVGDVVDVLIDGPAPRVIGVMGP
jgi:hypothetical protein